VPGDGRAREAAAAATARRGRNPGGVSEAALSGRWRHARGGRRASGARRQSARRGRELRCRDPLVSDFRIKNYPEGN
jgi:hypothetical protein